MQASRFTKPMMRTGRTASAYFSDEISTTSGYA